MKEELQKLIEERQRVYHTLDTMAGRNDETTRDLWRRLRELDEQIGNLQQKIDDSHEDELGEVEGVRKTLIQEIIDKYKDSLNTVKVEEKIAEIQASIQTHRDIINRLVMNDGNPEYIRNNEAKIAELEAELNGLREQSSKTISDEERTRIEDVLPELEDLLATSDPNLEYVPIEEIRIRIEAYKKHLEELLNRRKEKSEENKVSEEIAKLEKELSASAQRMREYKDAGAYDQEAAEHATYNELVRKINELKAKQRQEDEKGNNVEDKELDEEIRRTQNRIKELEDLEKLKEKFKGKGDNGIEIKIPDDPEIETEIDEEDLKEEYDRLVNDMYAKYYGNRDYKKEYKERVKRHKSHEVEVEENGIKYKTIEDYPEREEDEKFLLLKGYKEALERKTKYEAGDKNVYLGKEENIKQSYEKDKEFVETRNHTFEQHKSTQKDLATMGKYGEKMPYIPKQKGLLKNLGRVALNGMILGRNIVAPVYRFIGKYVAQPIHRAIFKDAGTPYENNIYHRMVARRDYFSQQAKLKDKAATEEKMKNAKEGEEVKEVKHPIRNYFSSRFKAIFSYGKGNGVVLSTGKKEIKDNLLREHTTKAYVERSTKRIEKFAEQVKYLEEQLKQNPNAKNAEQVKEAIESKKRRIALEKDSLEVYGIFIPETSLQTDAVSDKQHAVASKEVNTLRTTAIKGVAKLGVRKFVGPKLKQWLLEHAKTTEQEFVPAEVDKTWVDPVTEEKWVDPVTEEKWVDPVIEKKWTDAVTEQKWIPDSVETKEVPVFEEVFDTSKTAEEIMDANIGKGVTMFYKVDAGEIAPRTYTLDDEDVITGIFQRTADGGIGISDAAGFKAPIMGDQTFASELLDTNGVLEQGTTIQELINAVGSGKVDPKTFSDLYVAVSDRGWVKLSDLCGNMKVTEQVGVKLEEIIKPGYWDTIEVKPAGWEDVVVKEGFFDTVEVKPGYLDTVEIEPGYWKESIINPAHYVDKVVVNQKAVDAIERLAKAGKFGLVMDDFYDIFENVRNTHTEVKSNKPDPRGYKNEVDKEIPTNRREYKKHVAEDSERDDDR